MAKKKIITIAGQPGSGKSTTANRVAESLGYTRFSSGDFMRRIAKDRGVSIEEMNKIAEKEPSIDEEVDRALEALRENDLLVIDSRLAFHWIPESFKVYLDLDLDVAAQRIFADMNPERVASGEIAQDVKEIKRGIEKRLESEKKRYLEAYDLDPYDHSHFDLVIDTTNTPPEIVADRIVSEHTKWLAS